MRRALSLQFLRLEAQPQAVLRLADDLGGNRVQPMEGQDETRSDIEPRLSDSGAASLTSSTLMSMPRLVAGSHYVNHSVRRLGEGPRLPGSPAAGRPSPSQTSN
jgi:hypothetical protein